MEEFRTLVYENHITIFDRTERRLVDIYFRNCSVYREEFDCDYICFALSIPKLVEDLRKRG
jgi:hypothetical protein